VPGLPPYYLNMARHISTVEPPKGWDPNGPKEQALPYEEPPPKDEL
jgi:hypothetical protein